MLFLIKCAVTSHCLNNYMKLSRPVFNDYETYFHQSISAQSKPRCDERPEEWAVNGRWTSCRDTQTLPILSNTPVNNQGTDDQWTKNTCVSFNQLTLPPNRSSRYQSSTVSSSSTMSNTTSGQKYINNMKKYKNEWKKINESKK